MASPGAGTTPSVGFLTVVHYAQHGYFGGLLTLGPAGRPREFHCTLPVQPSRAQEILYGPTLRPYLCGEQIAAALLAKLATAPIAVLTDDADVLAVTAVTDLPVLLVDDDGDNNDITDDNVENNAPRRDDSRGPNVTWLDVCGWRLGARTHGVDAAKLAGPLGDFAANVDPLEPFERIRAAIDQAQRSAA
ncbi:MAG: hypothetical protein R3C10_01495 [Pirellulales bacterium]|nr:hypothetical protein [Planctomycetales bacterium]